MVLVRGLVVRVAGGKHHAFHAQGHHLIEEVAHAGGIGTIEERGVSRHPETAPQGFFDSLDGDIVAALAANRKIVVLALAVHVNGKSQVFAGTEQVDLFLEQQSVGAEINVFTAGHQSVDDLRDLRMHERLAAGNADHGSAAFLNGAEAFFRGEMFLENMGRILDLAAACAGEITAEERLQHQHKWIPFASRKSLLQDVYCLSPHFTYRY